MRRHRLTITTVALLSLACSALAPATAAAGGSLLSGYGGPGEGSQAILGSTLLNGPNGGGGASGEGSATPAGGGGAAGAGGGIAAGAAAGRRISAPVRTGTRPHRSRGGKPQAAAGGTRRDRATSVVTASAVSVASQPLGLSGGDLAYILLALASIGLTGVLTTRLARASA
jgi:hypothetical protein